MSKCVRRWSAGCAFAAALGLAGIGPEALSAWGLKFEVRLSESDPWSSAVNVPPVEGSVVRFRFGAYFDPGAAPVITTADGTGTAQALNRFTGSNQSVGFAPGDVFQNLVRTISSGNPALLSNAGATIGTTAVTSFGSQLFLADVPFEPYKEIYKGEVRLGSDPTGRTITIRNKTFGSGNTAGLTFYSSASLVNKQSGAPQASGPARFDLNASINIVNTCPSDLNFDHSVDESDFQIFLLAYQTMLCSDPAMPFACPADLNDDTLVDDADFIVFGHAYDLLNCP
ncbi:MAG: hypothetical protein J0L78_08990 [Planctomycetes bacterium]|nr:hypothetical protein [Planctomycetota bacterium]